MALFFKKFKRVWLITPILLVLLTSCVSSENEGKETTPVEAQKYFIKTSDSDLSPIKSYVEIISPKTLKAFPHLKGNIGNILLGNGLIQVVIEGVKPQESDELWQKVVGGIFEIKKEGVWGKLKEIDSVWIAKAINSRNFYFKKGIDIKRDAKTGGAFVSLSFGSKEGKYQNQQVRFFLGLGSTSVNFLADKEGSKWRFEIKTSHGSLFSGVSSVSSVGQDYKDVGGFVFYHNESAFSIISNFLIGLTKQDNEIFLSSVKPASVGFDFIQLVIGPAGGEKFPYWLASMAKCNQNRLLKTDLLKTPDPLVKLSLFGSCMSEVEKGFLTFDLSAEEDRKNRNFQRSFFIRDMENKLVGYSSIKPGTKTVIPLPADKPFLVEENNSVLKDTAPEKVQVLSQGSHVLIPKARRGAEVEIEFQENAPQKNSPAFFELIDLSDPEGQNPLIAVEENSSFKRIYDDVALVSDNPIEMYLPEGQYLLNMYRSTDGTICKAKISVKGSEDVKVNCIKEPRSIFDAAKDYKEISIGHKAMATDSETGLVLKLYSAKKMDDVLVSFSQKDRRGNLKEFSALARKLASDSILSLSCPGTNTTFEEYVIMIKQVKPDGLGLFGCSDQKAVQKFSKAFKELFADSKTVPPLVFPAPSIGKEKTQPYLPAVLIPNSKAEELSEGLLKGDYLLSAGAFF